MESVVIKRRLHTPPQNTTAASTTAVLSPATAHDGQGRAQKAANNRTLLQSAADVFGDDLLLSFNYVPSGEAIACHPRQCRTVLAKFFRNRTTEKVDVLFGSSGGRTFRAGS